jgi:hypothetical protein
MSNYHKAREVGYAAAAVLADAIVESAPRDGSSTVSAQWIFDALEAAVASVNGDFRDAFQRVGRAMFADDPTARMAL